MGHITETAGNTAGPDDEEDAELASLAFVPMWLNASTIDGCSHLSISNACLHSIVIQLYFNNINNKNSSVLLLASTCIALPGIVLSALQEVATIIVPVLQIKKLRH